jgi:hypothetical protein
VFALGALVIAITAPAGADVYQPGTLPRTYPASTNPEDNQLPVTLQLERTRYCLDCHDSGAYDTTRPGGMWKGSMMANAARDPLFYAALAIANQDLPGVGGDYCLRCHSPSGYLAGHTMPNPPLANLPAQLENPNRYPCNSYEPGSLTQCRCLATASGPCGDRDFCREPPLNVANGYCILNFEDDRQKDKQFQTHPFTLDDHWPEPNEQRVTLTDGGVAKDPYDDTEGLGCPFCHRITPKVTPVNRYGGNYHLSDEAEGKPLHPYWETPRSRRFGPYDAALTNCTNPRDPSTCDPQLDHPHPVAQSSLHTDSALCGICHDVTNPVYDRLSPDGTDLQFKMPIERTYSEWKSSDYAKPGPRLTPCQGCHMPGRSDGPLCLASRESDQIRPFDRSAPPRHLFTGGSVWMPSVFAAPLAPGMAPDGTPTGDPRWFYDLMRTVGREDAYLNVSRSAVATLQSAATVTVTPPDAARSGAAFSFGVRVTNNSGHKLPTGYPEGRRMWLQALAAIPSQGDGAPFFTSGGYDDARGVLTRDAQLKIYEVELGVAGAGPDPYPKLFHFVTNQIVYKDNRIPPSGFDPSVDPDRFKEMAPVTEPGQSYPTDGDGHLVNYDDSRYMVPVPPWARGDVEVTVRLVYQSTSKDYIEFLEAENRSNRRGQDLRQIWQNHGRAPFTIMASQTFTVQNQAPCVPGPELCNGLDDDCDGVVDNGACADLGVPVDDASAGQPADPGDGGMKRHKGHGCGVSVAGADWSDLGGWSIALAVLLVARRRSMHQASGQRVS